MKRILLSVFAAAAALLIAATAAFGLDQLKSMLGGGPFALIALLAGTAGLVLGIASWSIAQRLRQDLDRVAHSLDGALKMLAGIGQRNTSTIEELTDSVNRDIGRLSERLDRSANDRPVVQAAGDNVVALPLAIRGPRAAKTSSKQEPAAVQMAPTGPIEIHLEPIVSVSASAATGFEAYAGVRLPNGDEHLTRRLSNIVPVRDRIQFEMALFDAVVTASRRQLGQNARDIPIHVAMSCDVLEDGKAVARMLDVFKLHSGLEGQIVLCLPAAPASSSSDAAKALAKLSQVGAHFAIETAPDAEGGPAQLAAAGIDHLKLSVNRLLDRERGRASISGAEIVHQANAANIAVVASGVATDEDVLALMDLGVDLMAGARFSGPRRLKPAMSGPTNAAQGG